MRLIRKGSYATVTATAALVIALGGTSYAVTMVTSANIKDGTIQRVDLGSSALTVARGFYHDSGVSIQTQPSAGTDPLVMSAALPAGSYAINATTELGNDGAGGVLVRCTLKAGGDTDTKHSATGTDGNLDTQTMPLQLVHTFASAGTVTLRCYSFGLTASAYNTKFTAIKVHKLVNTPR